LEASLVFIAQTSSSSLVAILHGLGGLWQLGSVGSFKQFSLMGAIVCIWTGCTVARSAGAAVGGKINIGGTSIGWRMKRGAEDGGTYIGSGGVSNGA
jgi:hypothetical protein